MSGSYRAFWSYVHEDDEAERGRISALAKDVVAQYEMLTGDKLELFLDKNGIEWGDKWREKIDDSLASVAFFIPAMTPRYFMSVECRKELRFFTSHADKLGSKKLLLPLHYVNVPSLDEESSVGDDLLRMVHKFQWEDWRDLRHKEVTSEAYRRGVADLAARLAEANKDAEEAKVGEAVPEMEGSEGEEGDDAPGTMDRMAIAEERLPNWAVTITGITGQVEIIGEMMQRAASDINKEESRGGFARKLLVARRLAMELSGPTDKVSTLAGQFASQLHDVDDGFRAIIEQAQVEIKEKPSSKENCCDFFAAIRNLSGESHRGLSAAQQMIDSIVPIEKMSRDLRPVMRRLRQALTTMVEAGEVTDSWIGLIEASGVDC